MLIEAQPTGICMVLSHVELNIEEEKVIVIVNSPCCIVYEMENDAF